MANEAQLPHGTLIGLATLLFGIVGLLDALDLFQPGSAQAPVSWRETVLGGVGDAEPTWRQPRVTVPIAVAILLIGGLALGLPGLPWVTLAALAALGPSALRRPGLGLFVVVSLFYLPGLGTFDLWDPWETHYGEVAREILSRDDWISLWWAQENWFWSKPILIFWSEALTMSALGIEFTPDANPAHPEWALRLPIYALSMGALLATYTTFGKLFGRRAGFLCGLVMATMPQFLFLSHQAITDMPLAANLTMACAVLVLAFATDPDAESQGVRFGPVVVDARTVAIGALLLLALPQALYLLSRNVTLVDGFRFAWHGDQFLYGSAGNLGVPGNARLRDELPVFGGLAFQPFVQGLIWLAGVTVAVLLLRRERRVQAHLMAAFYLFCALGVLGKGIPGFALPGLVALLYLVASRRWSLLFEGRIRIGLGALLIAVVGLPWYVAMYFRHGPGFTDRILIHDHINRLAQGVHGDNGSIQYFIWQLGYATFPWIALMPAAILFWVWWRDQDAHRMTAGPGPYRKGLLEVGTDPAAFHRRETLTFIGIWFFAAFTLFSAMVTKFHHYIFPAVPPAAILVGLLVDRLWSAPKPEVPARATWIGTALALVAPAALVAGVGALYGNLRGVIPKGHEGTEDWVFDHGWGTGGAIALILVGVLLLFGALSMLESGRIGGRFWKRPALDARAAQVSLSLGVAMAAGAVVLAFVGRDLSWETTAKPQGYERLIHLFVYNYGRPWPEQFDYRPVLSGFAITATVLVALAAIRLLRPTASRALVGLALLFGTWTLNVYMTDLAPHWGLRNLVKTYYDKRDADPEQEFGYEPLIAWQMNWKGENFYSGNRVFVFVDLDNKKVNEWIAENQGRTAWFMFEHTRMGGFRSIMRGRKFKEITDERFNNKFVLVRAEL